MGLLYLCSLSKVFVVSTLPAESTSQVHSRFENCHPAGLSLLLHEMHVVIAGPRAFSFMIPNCFHVIYCQIGSMW